MQQIVTEIDDNIAIVGQNLDGLAADFGRLPKIALEAEISLLLAQHLRHHFHLCGDAIEPGAGQGKVMRFDRGIHASGHNQSASRSHRIALGVRGLRFLILAASGIEVAEREIGHI